MKITGILSILCALVVLIIVPVNVFAADGGTLPDPGITPDSPFYFADKWMKQISLAFSFGEEAKVQKALQYAQERLAEVNAMAVQDRTQAMEQAANEYQYCLDVATQNMERAMAQGKDTTGQVATMMSNHISLMNQVQNSGNEECQKIMAQTCEMSQNCQETAVKALAEKNTESALQLNLQLMEQECNRLNSCIGQDGNANTEEILQQYERLRTMNQEMLANAEQQGVGQQFQQIMEQEIAKQNQIINQVSTQLQTRNEGTSETALQNQVQEQQQLNTASGTGGQPVSTSTAETIDKGNETNPNMNSESGTNGNFSDTTNVESGNNQNSGGNRGN